MRGFFYQAIWVIVFVVNAAAPFLPHLHYVHPPRRPHCLYNKSGMSCSKWKIAFSMSRFLASCLIRGLSQLKDTGTWGSRTSLSVVCLYLWGCNPSAPWEIGFSFTAMSGAQGLKCLFFIHCSNISHFLLLLSGFSSPWATGVMLKWMSSGFNLSAIVKISTHLAY